MISEDLGMEQMALKTHSMNIGMTSTILGRKCLNGNYWVTIPRVEEIV